MEKEGWKRTKAWGEVWKKTKARGEGWKKTKALGEGWRKAIAWGVGWRKKTWGEGWKRTKAWGEGWKRQKLGEKVEWRIGVGRRPVGPSLLQTAVTWEPFFKQHLRRFLQELSENVTAYNTIQCNRKPFFNVSMLILTWKHFYKKSFPQTILALGHISRKNVSMCKSVSIEPFLKQHFRKNRKEDVTWELLSNNNRISLNTGIIEGVGMFKNGPTKKKYWHMLSTVPPVLLYLQDMFYTCLMCKCLWDWEGPCLVQCSFLK